MTWRFRFCDVSLFALCKNSLVFVFQILNVILGVYFPLETEFLRIFAKILKNMVAMEAVERRYGVGQTFQFLLLELNCVSDPFTSHNIWLDHWCPCDEPARKGLNYHIIKNNLKVKAFIGFRRWEMFNWTGAGDFRIWDPCLFLQCFWVCNECSECNFT